MSSGRRGRDALGRAEWILAILLTALALLLHWSFFTHSGGLWRDEVNSVEFARMPSLRAIVASLQFDGFPLLSTLLLRAWLATPWGNGDLGVRAFGLIVGLALLGALWITARLFRRPVPVLSLALVGLSPVAIQAADSIRPYGLGMALIVAATGTLWRAVESPTLGRLGVASAFAILSVQCMYQNAFLLFGACMAGILVAWRRRGARAGAAIGMVGATAALSLLPYAPSIRAAQSWNVLNQGPTEFAQRLAVLASALGGGGAMGLWLWVGLIAVCAGIAAAAGRTRSRDRAASAKPELPLFSVAAVAAATVTFLAALTATRLPTQVWYYAPLMAAAAPMLDSAAWAGPASKAQKLTRMALAILIAAAAVPGYSLLRERRTNVDLVASMIASRATPEDLIVIYPWYNAVSFRRYYAGGTAWTTLPPLEDLRIHRYDLLRSAMSRPDPIGPVLMSMGSVLQSGHRVWLVGGLPPAGSEPEPALPPAPHPRTGWNNGPYVVAWGRQATRYLQSHALSGERIPSPAVGPVSPFENLPIAVVSGWH